MTKTKIISGAMNDKHILNYLKESKTVKEWNERREEVKSKGMRSNEWITKNVDAAGLIRESKIPKN